MITIKTEKDFKTAREKIKAIQAEIYKPRCVNCLYRHGSNCTKFGAIPDEFLYLESECEQYEENIPF